MAGEDGTPANPSRSVAPLTMGTVQQDEDFRNQGDFFRKVADQGSTLKVLKEKVKSEKRMLHGLDKELKSLYGNISRSDQALRKAIESEKTAIEKAKYKALKRERAANAVAEQNQGALLLRGLNSFDKKVWKSWGMKRPDQAVQDKQEEIDELNAIESLEANRVDQDDTLTSLLAGVSGYLNISDDLAQQGEGLRMMNGDVSRTIRLLVQFNSILKDRGVTPSTMTYGRAKGGSAGDSQIKEVQMTYNTDSSYFSVASMTTFQDLLYDACRNWGLNPHLTVLTDGDRCIWPMEGKVRVEFQRNEGRSPKVILHSKEDLGYGLNTMKAVCDHCGAQYFIYEEVCSACGYKTKIKELAEEDEDELKAFEAEAAKKKAEAEAEAAKKKAEVEALANEILKQQEEAEEEEEQEAQRHLDEDEAEKEEEEDANKDITISLAAQYKELELKWLDDPEHVTPPEMRALTRVWGRQIAKNRRDVRSDYRAVIGHFLFIAALVIIVQVQRDIEQANEISSTFARNLTGVEFGTGDRYYQQLDPATASLPAANDCFPDTSCAASSQDSINPLFPYAYTWGPYITWDEITDLNQFWSFMANHLADTLFPKRAYGKVTIGGSGEQFQGLEYFDTYRATMFMQNRIIGGVRIRQVRVTSDSCLLGVSDPYRGGCYGIYNDPWPICDTPMSWIGLQDWCLPAQDTSTMTPSDSGYTTDCESGTELGTWCQAFDYRSRSALDSSNDLFRGGMNDRGIWGDFGGGYAWDFLLESNSQTLLNDLFVDGIMRLKKYEWIDIRTRRVYINFSVYSPKSGLFTFVDMQLNLLPSGKINTKANFRTLRVNTFSVQGTSGFLRMAIAVIMLPLWLILFISYVFKGTQYAIRTCMKKGFMSSWWHQFLEPIAFIDFLILLTIFIGVISFIYFQFDTTSLLLLNNFSDNLNSKFIDLGAAEANYRLAFDMFGIAIVLSFFKTFKYFRRTLRLSFVWVTLSYAAGDLIAFMLIFSIVFGGFLVWANISFGPNHEFFNTLRGSLTSLILLLLGDFQGVGGYEGMRESNLAAGVIFFSFFLVLMVFIMLNIFLAILAESYANAKTREIMKLKQIEVAKDAAAFYEKHDHRIYYPQDESKIKKKEIVGTRFPKEFAFDFHTIKL